MTIFRNRKTHICFFTALAAAAVLFFAGCAVPGTSSASGGTASVQLFAMDTYMTITVYGEDAEEAAEAASAEITRLDALLSAQDEDSEIYALNEAGGGSLSGDTAYLISRALEIADMTDGAFDIAVYPLMVLWGFPTQEYAVPDAEEIAALLPAAEISNVILTEAADASGDGAAGTLVLENGAQIDLGGIAKGYLSDRMKAIFDEYDLTGAICSLGGNICTYGAKTDGSEWNIGIQDPAGDTGTDVAGALTVSDVSVITSGGYERYFEEDGVTYHHILDPATGYPADSGLASVTIVSADGTLSDGLSTALFVMGEEEAVAFWQANSDLFEMILIDENGDMTISEGLDGNFSANDGSVKVTVVTAE